MTPMQTPDYQRGHLAGYADGMSDAQRQREDEYRFSYEFGVRSVRK